MEFLYPGFLYALSALAIPVIVHLFNFRRFKKVPFTNVRFLRDIKRQTQSQNKLRHLLILMMRMLALTFLVLAFAQPFLPSDQTDRSAARNHVSIFVDNSFSMEGESSSGTLIEVAKNKAIDIAMAFESADRFQLLTQDFEGKHQRLVNREVFIEWVQELELSPQSRSLEEIYTRQRDLLSNSGTDANHKAFVISDFQKSRFMPEGLNTDSLLSISLVLLERSDPGNLFIDSVWFESPVRKLNDSERLMVRVANTSDGRVEKIPIRLDVNGQQKTIAAVSVDATSDAVAEMEYLHEEAGLQLAEVRIQDSPISYDDTWYFAYDVFNEIKVLNIRAENAGADDPFKTLFAPDSVYRYEAVNVKSVDYSVLATNQMVILSGLSEIPSGLSAELKSFTESGGSLWVMPGVEIDIESYNTLLTALGGGPLKALRNTEERVRALNTEHPLYRDIFESIPQNVDLPTVLKYYPGTVTDGGDMLMSLANGSPFLASFTAGLGKFYLSYTALAPEHSNFLRHALFVATSLRIAELSQSTAMRNIPLKSDAFFNISGDMRYLDGTLRLINEQAQVEVIPSSQMREGQYLISPGPEVQMAGLYTLKRGNEVLSGVGINYLREESELASFNRTELDEAVSGLAGVRVFDGTSENLTRDVALASSGQSLWKICIILALVFLLFEQLLIRFRKPSAV